MLTKTLFGSMKTISEPVFVLSPFAQAVGGIYLGLHLAGDAVKLGRYAKRKWDERRVHLRSPVTVEKKAEVVEGMPSGAIPV